MMAGLWLPNGSSNIYFDSLGVLNGKKIEVAIQNLTLTTSGSGFVFGQASQSTSDREFALLRVGTYTKIFLGGIEYTLGEDSDVFNGLSLDNINLNLVVNVNGDTSLSVGGVETHSANYARGSARIDTFFRIGAINGGSSSNVAGGTELGSGAKVGRFIVWVDDVLTLDVTMPSQADATQVTDSVSGLIGTLVGGDGSDFELLSTPNTEPVIIVSGSDTTTITVGDATPVFTATASDSEDGDLTASIVVTGDEIDTSTAGTYVKRYNVQDSGGLAADEVTRTVIVEAAPLIDTDILPNLNINKVVFIGASITNDLTSTSRGDLAVSYVKEKYGVDIEIINEGVGGRNVNGLNSAIDDILLNHQNEPNTVFMMHIGGNDITFLDDGAEEFLERSLFIQNSKKEQLAEIYDKIHANGNHVFQSSITYRDYDYAGGKVLDEGLTISRELKGSYTYTRDWVVPVMEDKAPYALHNRGGQKWPMIDGYNASRNNYEEWKRSDQDVVHMSPHGSLSFLLYQLDCMFAMTSGIAPSQVDRFDYTAPAEKASQQDILIDLKPEDNVGNQTTDGIDVLSSNVKSLSNLGINNSVFAFLSSGGIDNSGSGAGVTGATIDNSEILEDGVGNTGAAQGRLIFDGLEPLKEYKVEVVSSASTDRDTDISLAGKEFGDYTIDGTAKFSEDFVRADSSGKIIVSAINNNPSNMWVLSGAKVSSSDVVANQPPTANAGPDQSVAAGAAVTLDGTSSTDGDGTIVSYAWSQSAGDAVILTGVATATPSFTAPSTNAAQTLTFDLTVTDDGGLTATDSVNVAAAAEIPQPDESTILFSLPGIPDGAHDVVIVDRVGGINLTVEGVTFANGTGSALIPLAIGSAVDYYTYNETTREAGLQVEGITQ